MSEPGIIYAVLTDICRDMDEEDLIDIKIPVPLPDRDDTLSDDEKDPKDSLLEEKRRDSIAGIKPSPMPGVNVFSRFVSFW